MIRLTVAVGFMAALVLPAQADPFAIAILGALGYSGAAGLLAPTAVLTSLAANALIAALPGILINVALVGGAALFSGARQRQQEPKPSEQQQTVRQSLGPRRRFYGRVKVGGTMWFFESLDGRLYSGITIQQGRIFNVAEVWLADQQVSVDGSGYVTSAPYVPGLVRVQFQLGTADQAVYTTLLTDFAGLVTSAHRNRGVATALITYQDVAREDVPEVYPRGAPGLRLVVNASLVHDPRDPAQDAADQSTWGWSDNPALCIRDYLTHDDGLGWPASIIDEASFAAFADRCDELVPLKAGGSIKRYRLWGGYLLTEKARDVLPRMLRTCDAELYFTPAGTVAIRGGGWEAPTVSLGPDQIIAAEWSQGQAALSAFNELRLSYVDPGLDYQEVEGEPWADADNIRLRGETLSEPLDLFMVPHHAQARRLAKIMMHKGNPEWIGALTLNAAGFDLVGEPSVHIVFPDLGIDHDFVITRLGFTDDFTGTTIEVSSLTSDAYGWNAASEEGTAPAVPPDTSSEASLAAPDDIHVVAGEDATGTFLVAVWERPERASLIQQGQYRLTAGSSWGSMAVLPGETRTQSGYVTPGEDYDVIVRNVSPAGVPGDWSAIATVTATADLTAPGLVTSVVATGGQGLVALAWTQPASSNGIGALVYRNTVNTFATSTPTGQDYGGPLEELSWTDQPLPAGTYYFFVVAINASGIQGTPVATGAVAVT